MAILLLLGLLAAITLYGTVRTMAARKASRQNRHHHQPLSITLPGTVEQNRSADCEHYRLLYYKLHNLERHLDVLADAKSLLLSLFSETLRSEENTQSTLLELKSFSSVALESFIQGELAAVTTEWRDYVARRKAGHPRELFPTAADARAWLVRIAPLKFVDGAWLGHVHKLGTSFATRRVTKAAWQILSEELGDGDLKKCHAYVFAQLLAQIGLQKPAPDSPEFMQHAGMDDVGVWRSAVAQLLISLFPHEFLPEILGFNLHFEMLALDTLVAARELRELGIDSYYFTLHITIDNADTGHVAMASRIVTDYLQLIAQTQGNAAVDQEWRRIQAGYVLSKNTSRGQELKDLLGAKVLDLFQAKSVACDKIHDHCPASIKGRPLSIWLDPELISRPEWQVEFLRSLEDARPWVFEGDSARSRLIQQCAWGGCMFGAFTDREVMILRNWIDSLAPPSGPEVYRCFTGRKDLERVMQQRGKFSFTMTNHVERSLMNRSDKLDAPRPLVVDMRKLDMHKLLPIWFAHASLLECFVSVPWLVATSRGCAIVRMLRAQYGFLPEPVGVDGIDEMSRADLIDLVSIGCEMVAAADPESALPVDLDGVLRRWPSPYARDMLAAATRPREMEWWLLGTTQSFVRLHAILASSCTLLSESTRTALSVLSGREEESLAVCRAELHPESSAYRDFEDGCALATREIELCCK